MGTNTDALMEKRGDSIPNDIARLKGARLVTASETKAGKRLAEGLLKQATGEDTITARFLRQEFFDFKPEFKIWLACNHLPRIDGQDHGIWRRIKLIPFNAIFRDASCREGPYKDIKLISKLTQEFPGILRWAADGCLLWQEEGLEAPVTIATATGDYQSAMDIIGDFVSERCVSMPEAKTPAKDLYAAYCHWCDENGEKPESQRSFGMRIGERGSYRQKRGTKGRREWHGIGLIGDDGCSGGTTG
jgi:putative DNA primase/helicase